MATERVVDQIAAEFDGEDPLKPHSRAGLQKARRSAEELAVLLEAFGTPARLGDPDDEEVSALRALVERNGKLFRVS